jgi:hypothetical protein
VIDIISNERRSYVRGDISFKVKFKIMSPEEYQDLKRSNKEIFSHDKREKGIDITGTGNKDAYIAPNTYLIDFLLYMDEKLDQILAFVSQDMPDKESLNQGIGSNISGSGMNIITDKPLELGKIIHTNFVLSRFPLVFIDVFGEIVRVTPVDEDGKTSYHVGTKFLDLNINNRERIIACVFQRQREAIRKKKGEKSKPEI